MPQELISMLQLLCQSMLHGFWTHTELLSSDAGVPWQPLAGKGPHEIPAPVRSCAPLADLCSTTDKVLAGHNMI